MSNWSSEDSRITYYAVVAHQARLDEGTATKHWGSLSKVFQEYQKTNAKAILDEIERIKDYGTD